MPLATQAKVRIDDADPSVFPKHERVAKKWQDDGGVSGSVDALQVRTMSLWKVLLRT